MGHAEDAFNERNTRCWQHYHRLDALSVVRGRQHPLPAVGFGRPNFTNVRSDFLWNEYHIHTEQNQSAPSDSVNGID